MTITLEKVKLNDNLWFLSNDTNNLQKKYILFLDFMIIILRSRNYVDAR